VADGPTTTFRSLAPWKSFLEKREVLGNNEKHVFAAQRYGQRKYVKAATNRFYLEVNELFLDFYNRF